MSEGEHSERKTRYEEEDEEEERMKVTMAILAEISLKRAIENCAGQYDDDADG